MKKNKVITCATLTLAGMHLYNIWQKKLSLDYLCSSIFSVFQYKWKYGDIAYTKQGTGKPILLIHDLTAGSSMFEWQYVVSGLEKNYTIYALDLLGCGESEKPDCTYTNFLFVQLIHDFIRDIIGESCDVITSGDSSAIGIMSSLYDESSIHKMIFINPQKISGVHPEIKKKEKYRNLIFQCPIIGTFFANRLNNKEHFENLFYSTYFYDSSSINYFADAYASNYQYNNTSKAIFSSIYNHYTDADCQIALKKIQNPISIILGSEISDKENMIKDYKNDWISPSIDFYEIEKTKHLPQLENPDNLIEQLLNILKN